MTAASVNPKRQIGVTSDQFADPPKVLLAAIKLVLASLKIGKEGVKHDGPATRLDYVRHFGKDGRRHHVWPAISTERLKRALVIRLAD